MDIGSEIFYVAEELQRKDGESEHAKKGHCSHVNSLSSTTSKKRKVCEANLHDNDLTDGRLGQSALRPSKTRNQRANELCEVSTKGDGENDDLTHLWQEPYSPEYDDGMDIFQGPVIAKVENNHDIDAAIGHYNAGQAFRKEDDLVNALSSYQLALNTILPYISGFKSVPTEEVNRIAIPVLYNLGLVQHRTRSNEESIGFFEFAIAETRKSEEATSFTVAAALNCLGFVLLHTKNLRKSLFCLEESLEIFRKLFGLGSKWEALVLNNIGRAHVGMGDHSAGVIYFGQAMEIRRNLLGALHIDYLSSALNTAECMHRLGRCSEALPLYRECLNLAESLFPKKHHHIPVVLSSMAQIYQSQGEVDQARDLYEQCLQIGPNAMKSKPNLLAVLMNRVGNFYFDNGDFCKALEVYNRGLRIEKNVLEPDHPNITTTLGNIAEIHRQTGNLSMAIETYNQAVETLESRHGPESVQAAAALNFVGLVHVQKGDTDTALTLFQRVLTIRRAVLGDGHIDVASTLMLVGTTLFRKNMITTALEQFLESYRIHKADLDLHKVHRSFSAFNIGFCLQLQGDYEEAIEYYKESLQIQKSLPKDQQKDLKLTLVKMSESMSARGDLPGALEYLEQALAVERETVSENEDLVKIFTEMGVLYQATGQTDLMMNALCEAARLAQSHGISIDHLETSRFAVDLSPELVVTDCPSAAAA